MRGQHKMDRVVVAIDSGEYVEATDPYFVPYLIFELCEGGDVRRHRRMGDPGVSVEVTHISRRLRWTEAAAFPRNRSSGLEAFHLLVFELETSKIAHLGRSSWKGTKADGPGHAGDLSYMPIELQYNHHDPDRDTRRRAVDLYTLVGLFAFLVSDVHIFGLIVGKLPSSHHQWFVGYV